jgi:hypothetical protein
MVQVLEETVTISEMALMAVEINGYSVRPDAPFTVVEVARILGRSPVTVYRMISRNELSPVFKSGNKKGKITVWGSAIISKAGLTAVKGAIGEDGEKQA